MKRATLKKHINEFFGNNFAMRFILWIIGIGVYCFGLNFIVRDGIGQDTYSALLNPIRISLGVNIDNFGTFILIPAGILLIILAIILNFSRVKKIRIDYVLAVLPLVFSGVLTDLVGKIPFFETLFKESENVDLVITEYPLHILWIFIGVFILYVGIGIFSGVRVMPNAYAIFIVELSIKLKANFSLLQFIVDFGFAFVGIIIMIICASVGRIDDGHVTNWYDLLKIASLGTLIALLIHGVVLDKTIKIFEKIFDYERHI